MNRLRWMLARQGDRLSLLTLLSWLSVITLVVAALWLFLLIKSPLLTHNSETQPGEDKVVIIQPAISSGEALLAGAPKLIQITNAVETLYRVAEQHQLLLEEVIYQDRPSQDKVLLEYVIDFRVEQSYPRIKAFMTELLAALPYLALEQISFERDDISNGQIRSHCRFKLFLERNNG